METKLQDKKIELIQWLSTLEDSSLIDEIMELRVKERCDWWSQISSDEKESIEKGIIDADNGKITSHELARKGYEKWL